MENSRIFVNHADFYFFLKRNPYLLLKNKDVTDFRNVMTSVVSGCQCDTKKMQHQAIKIYTSLAKSGFTESEKDQLKNNLDVDIIKFKLGTRGFLEI